MQQDEQFNGCPELIKLWQWSHFTFDNVGHINTPYKAPIQSSDLGSWLVN